MFVHTRRDERSAEYSEIVDPQPEGAVIGFFAGKPFSERVVDIFGRHFSYVGVACRRRDGEFDATVLKPGEFIAEPGLVYRLMDPRGSASLRRAA